MLRVKKCSTLGETLHLSLSLFSQQLNHSVIRRNTTKTNCHILLLQVPSNGNNEDEIYKYELNTLILFSHEPAETGRTVLVSVLQPSLHPEQVHYLAPPFLLWRIFHTIATTRVSAEKRCTSKVLSSYPS